MVTQLATHWRITVGRNRLTRRWFADLGIQGPDAPVASHVSHVGGFRTERAAYNAAAEIARAEDQDAAKWVGR